MKKTRTPERGQSLGGEREEHVRGRLVTGGDNKCGDHLAPYGMRSCAPAERTARSGGAELVPGHEVLIRHLTGDPPEMAAGAIAALAAAEELLLADLVVAECLYCSNPSTRSSAGELPS